jgi:hypothetical protein
MTHRFLRERLGSLDTAGVQQAAGVIKAERRAAAAAEREVLDRQGATTDAMEAKHDITLDTANVGDIHGDSDGVEPIGVSPRAVLAGLVALGAAVWVVPRARRAWQAKGQPRVEAWRALRAAAKTSATAQPDAVGGAGEGEALD